MLFSPLSQQFLFIYHLVAVSAIVPRGGFERSSFPTSSFNSSKYTNSSSSSSFCTSLSSTSSRLSSETLLVSTNLSKFSSPGSLLGTAYASRETPDVTVFGNADIGTRLLKDLPSATIIPPHYASVIANSNASSHLSTKTNSKSKTVSSSGKDVTISKTRKCTSKKTLSHASGITYMGKNGTTNKATSLSHKANVTSMPNHSMFGSQTITRASCKSTTLGKSAEHYCRVMIGTLQLHYWPTGTAVMNRSYPSTIYLEDYNITMTSPSVYFAINTMKATDLCGKQVGPTIKNYAVGYDVTDVYTLQPYANTKVKTRMGDPKQLRLSDLRTDCPQTTILPEDMFDYLETNHVVLGQDSQCNPILSWPTDLRLAAGDFWTTCGRHWVGKLGIFDPPIPVTACTGDASACLYGPTKIFSTTASTTKLTEFVTALADQITTTSALPAPTISAGPLSTGNEEFASILGLAKSSLASLSSTASLPKSTSGLGPTNFFFSAQTTPGVVASFELSVESSLGTIDLPDPQATITSIALEINSQSTSPSPPSPTVIAIVTSNTFATLPGSSGIILLNGSTASSGEVVTISNLSSGSVRVSVGISNILVGSETYSIPTVSLVPQNSVSVNMGVVSVHSISVEAISLEGLSAAVIGDQKISIEGPAATLTESNIASLGASGGVIQAPEGTITAIPVPSGQTDPVNMAIVNGQTISVVAGSFSLGVSMAIVAQQTISVGGPAATLSGGQIASLGTSGVVIKASNGYSTTIPVPSSTTPVSSAGSVPVGVDGGQIMSVEVIQSGSGAIMAGQTLSYEGPIATISGGNVVTLGVNGVVVQAPGGKATTIPRSTTYFASASDKAIKTFEFGAPTTDPSALDASSGRTGSATLVQSNNSAQRVGILWLSRLLFGWVGILIMIQG
ncbi:hypothetical protein EYC80_003843 [Monilinia laxa]|uniref:Uncharacterized protein n=1 Tax=Monilinia laxa TaxID=61186 RepID=A0A5N6KL95_MONLA|nr:hypothetical protein EYC80_003843 [Monilinia laxa]